MALQITGLSKTYPNGVRALKNLSLTVGNNMFGLLGPNGAGKSSLMRTIATLQDPDSGSIELDGLNVLKQKNAVRKVLGYLPQEFGVYPKMSAIDMLNHLAILKGVTAHHERREMVEALLHQTNLWDARKKALSTYSGGMKQRFGIAQALLANPRLIIVDEPTAGLDPAERNRFLNLLSSIGRDVTVILSTHIVDDVRELCSRMAIIASGEVLLEGSPTEALSALAGQMWSRVVATDAELHALESQMQVVSTHLVGGQHEIRVFAASSPGGGLPRGRFRARRRVLPEPFPRFKRPALGCRGWRHENVLGILHLRAALPQQEHFHLRVFSAVVRLLVLMYRLRELRAGGQRQRQGAAERTLRQHAGRHVFLLFRPHHHCRDFRHVDPAGLPARHLSDAFHQADLQICLFGRTLGRLLCHDGRGVFWIDGRYVCRNVCAMGRSCAHRTERCSMVSAAVLLDRGDPDLFHGHAVFRDCRADAQTVRRISAGRGPVHAVHHRPHGVLGDPLAGALLVRHLRSGRAAHGRRDHPVLERGRAQHPAAALGFLRIFSGSVSLQSIALDGRRRSRAGRRLGAIPDVGGSADRALPGQARSEGAAAGRG